MKIDKLANCGNCYVATAGKGKKKKVYLFTNTLYFDGKDFDEDEKRIRLGSPASTILKANADTIDNDQYLELDMKTFIKIVKEIL